MEEDYNKKYNIMKRIGRGNYTEVYMAETIEGKELRAIKIIKLDDIKLDLEALSDEEKKNEIDNFIRYLRNEIENMKICGENNENSVKLYESFKTGDKFVIVMELADEDLVKFKNGKKFNSKDIYEILIQLNNTFKIMKEKRIVHRDLKPQNILIKYKSQDKKDYIVKLCDYGISKKTTKYEQVKTKKIGTKDYMAPEVIDLEGGSNYDYKCDLWSLGIIIYELLFGKVPYQGLNENIILNKIKSNLYQLQKTNDQELDDLISKLLEKNPNKRITWDEYFNHSFFSFNNKDVITIRYTKNKNIIKIFGKEFVKNNKDKCKIKYEGKEFELQEYFKINSKQNIFKLILTGINNVTDMSYMFSGCESLESLPDISKWDTNNITKMRFIFFGCKFLKSLPDISKWNTNNVTDMGYMFYGCESLKSLPDISKWNTDKVIDMSYFFSACKSLEYLPDISKWNTSNVINMSDMFNGCKSLQSLPNISSWNTSNVTNMYGMFSSCSSLKSLPDITKWNIDKVTKMDYILSDCDSLDNLPDVSKLKIINRNP